MPVFESQGGQSRRRWCVRVFRFVVNLDAPWSTVFTAFKEQHFKNTRRRQKTGFYFLFYFILNSCWMWDTSVAELPIWNIGLGGQRRVRNLNFALKKHKNRKRNCWKKSVLVELKESVKLCWTTLQACFDWQRSSFRQQNRAQQDCKASIKGKSVIWKILIKSVYI